MAGENQQQSLKPPISVITANSPCIGHCTTVLGDEVCRSCLRTFDEITRWVGMSDEQRCAVNQRIAVLQQKNNPPQPSLDSEGARHSSPDKGRLGGV